jgi:hypothetical protein
MTAVPDPSVIPERSSRAPAHGLPAPAAASPRASGRLSMIGRHLCLGLGCFALAAAALLPLVVYPRLAVLPADPQKEQLLSATGATVLVPDAKAPAGATQLTGVDVTVSNYISAAPGTDTHDSVVWQIATQFNVNGHGMTNARVEQVSLDPHTAKPTNCCGDRIVTSLEDTAGKALTHDGYVAWPFNAQKHSYQIWDINLEHSTTAAFVGEETRDGLRTYRYQTNVPLRNVGTMDLPGGLFGSKTPTVTAQTQYSDKKTYWIQPVTGDVIALNDQITQQYTYGGHTLVAFAASLHSPRLPADRLSDDRTGATVLPWLRVRASLVLVPIGLILLVAGVFLARRRRES